MKSCFSHRRCLLFLNIAVAFFILTAPPLVTAAVAPLRVLLITGGCCHDYAKQKDILKKGLEERANVVVDQVHTDDTSTHPPLAILGNPEYAKGYDLVIHDECAADVSFDYLGLQSSAHGPQTPISIHYTDKESPIAKGSTDWTTINEEHYNNIHVFDSAHAIAHGVQMFKQKDGTQKTNDFVVAWINHYGPKQTRVFSTTIGHNNATVADPRYLDLVTRGVLWSTGHLNDDGTPAQGYGPAAR